MNKTLRTTLLGLMATCGTAAWAQTDVTSQYLVNADFSQGTPAAIGICTYGRDMSGNGTENYGLLDVEGWTKKPQGPTEDGYENCALAGGLVAFGSGVWIGGKGYNAPVTNADGETTGNILGIVCVWGGQGTYNQTVTLPAGTYTLVVPIYNSVGGTGTDFTNLIGFAEEGGTTHYTTNKTYPVNQWKYEFIEFTLDAETKGDVQLGYKGDKGSGAMPHLFISGISLFSGSVDAASYEAAKEATRTAKEAVLLLADEAYAIVTGDERTALQAAIDNGSDTATLKAAMQAFKDAKASYADYDAAQEAAASVPELPYALAAKKPLVSNQAVTNAAQAKELATAIYTAIRAYYESNALAESVEGAVNMTTSIVNPDASNGNNGWTTTGKMNDPRNGESWTDANGKNDYMYFDGGNWGGTGWTTTMSQKLTLPAGKYLLTAKGRASQGVTLTMAVGEASVALPNVGAAGNVFDRGWNDGYVEFSNPEGEDVEILITATTEGKNEWFSVGDFRLMQLEKLEVEKATDEDVTALLNAILAAAKHEPGFDKGEYAPYNNVEALTIAREAIALADQIDETETIEVSKKKVTETTAALEAAVWTVNETDVDIVFNGMFATVTPDANYPLGWTRTNAWGQMQSNLEGDYATAYYNQPGSLQYGNQGVYFMPLKADQWYKLTVCYRSHENESNKGLTVSVLNEEGEGLKDQAFEANASTSEWVKAQVCFKPATDDEYVLTLANSGNTWLTNVSIEKTVESDPVGISEAPVAKTAADQAIYNLAGQRVQKTGKGLYIIGGKKVIK